MGTAGKESQSYTGDFHASNGHLAWQVSGRAGTTTDISGRNFRAWSVKLDLVGSWLKTYLASCELPSTTFARTWSASATPSGFGLMKLRLSARRTAGCEFSLWGTPNTMDHLPQRSPGSLIRMRDETRKGRAKPTNLREQVDEDTVRLWRTPKADDPNHGAASEAGILRRLEKGQTIRLQDQVNHPGLFRTPDAGCSRGAQSKERFAESLKEGRLLTLNDQVAHLFFPTPRATDGDRGTRSAEGSLKELARGHGMDLGSSVQIFPTPTCNDAKNNNPPSQRTENGRHSDQLPVPAWGNVVAGGFPEPGLGGVADGLPHWLDSGYWRVEPDISRVAKGVKNRVARLRALGNAVVPAQAYPIFRAIAEIEKLRGDEEWLNA